MQRDMHYSEYRSWALLGRMLRLVGDLECDGAALWEDPSFGTRLSLRISQRQRVRVLPLVHARTERDHDLPYEVVGGEQVPVPKLDPKRGVGASALSYSPVATLSSPPASRSSSRWFHVGLSVFGRVREYVPPYCP